MRGFGNVLSLTRHCEIRVENGNVSVPQAGNSPGMLTYPEIHLKPGCQHVEERGQSQVGKKNSTRSLTHGIHLGFVALPCPQRLLLLRGEPPCASIWILVPPGPLKSLHLLFSALNPSASLCFPQLLVCFCVPLVEREEERQEGETRGKPALLQLCPSGGFGYPWSPSVSFPVPSEASM